MSKRLPLNSRAPYERICTACMLVRPPIEFANGRRICTSCLNGRMDGAIPSGTTGRGPRYPTYDAAELRPFIGRPGALDAFSLPSLRFGQRVLPHGAPSLSSTTPKEFS